VLHTAPITVLVFVLPIYNPEVVQGGAIVYAAHGRLWWRCFSVQTSGEGVLPVYCTVGTVTVLNLFDFINDFYLFYH
jgi:hypothetical protein